LWERTAQSTVSYLTDLFNRRLRPGESDIPDAVDAATVFMVLVVLGSGQMSAWGWTTEDEFDRQVTYRVKLFLNGACSTKLGRK
jgi:hypothetical protein